MSISQRLQTSGDKDFLWALHCDTMRAYVEEVWGWDEQWQRQRFMERFDRNDIEIIEVDGIRVGAIQVDRRPGVIYLNNIHITPSRQRHGIGTEMVRIIMDEAEGQGVPIRLQVLKVNPARAFYEQLGFCENGATETHVLMERVPGSPAG
jgi:ribosomal protein S18 acetylase RimI-like enzyme